MFDRVLQPNSAQEQVYDACAKQIVKGECSVSEGETDEKGPSYRGKERGGETGGDFFLSYYLLGHSHIKMTLLSFWFRNTT